jgi:hypothetical protein
MPKRLPLSEAQKLPSYRYRDVRKRRKYLARKQRERRERLKVERENNEHRSDAHIS